MKKALINKTINVIIGSIIMGVGISLTIYANLGSDPMTLFWQGIANTLSITLGQANLLVCCTIMIFVYFLNKKYINVGSLLNPIVIALTTDILGKYPVVFNSIIIQMFFCVVGLIVLAYGISYYTKANFGEGAFEALVFSIAELSKIKVGIIRTISDITLALLGLLLGGNLSIGTILAIILMGSGIQFFMRNSRTKSNVLSPKTP